MKPSPQKIVTQSQAIIRVLDIPQLTSVNEMILLQIENMSSVCLI
jgi:hypothetical protein